MQESYRNNRKTMSYKPVLKKSRFIKRCFRRVRKYYYFIIDNIFGAKLFILRALKIISKQKVFDEKEAKKILLIRMDRIGDFILTTPAFRSIREKYHDTKISLLIPSYLKDLAVNNPCIDEVLIYQGMNSYSGVIKVLKKKSFDLVIIFHPSFKLNLLSFFIKAKWRIGYKAHGGGFLLSNGLVDDRDKRVRHEVESALEIAGIAGAKTEDKSLVLNISNENKQWADKWLESKGINSNEKFAVIHSGSNQPYIRWKKEGFSQVADWIIDNKIFKIIIIGGAKEEGVIDEVVKGMKHIPIVLNNISLGQLSAVMGRSSLFIGNSTGPMHIASALKVPVVAIFGNIHPLDSYQEWGPWSKNSIIVSKDLDCDFCHPGDCKSFDCMELITAEDVIKAIKNILK